jgi:hypothetical protein
MAVIGSPLIVDLMKSSRMASLQADACVIIRTTTPGARHVSNEISRQVDPCIVLHMAEEAVNDRKAGPEWPRTLNGHGAPACAADMSRRAATGCQARVR